jgi:bifunctional DNA-binding transcriptional regulator/antitoxin component of YhaV-PrlF toxin-antitoxin module
LSDIKSIQKKVSFGTVSVQKLRRVTIPPHLAENMNIGVGDELAVFFDPDCKAAVFVKAEADKRPADKPAKKVRPR